MTRREVLEQIKLCEERGEFDAHVDPIPSEIVIPVDENYHYPNNRTVKEKIKLGLQRIFIVNPFTLYQNKIIMRTKVIGREHLRGLGAAVLICNHVAKFDCLAVRYAARGHKVYSVAAPFNNMRGFLGQMMRAGDMMPMSESMRGMVNFHRAVGDVLVEKKEFLLVYPEASMWWHYKKPRPYKDGAFAFAAKYGVPVVPIFITYRDSRKYDNEGCEIPYFTVNIKPPIYPDSSRSRQNNINTLRNYAFEMCREMYEETYGKTLVYECESEQKTNLSEES